MSPNKIVTPAAMGTRVCKDSAHMTGLRRVLAPVALRRQGISGPSSADYRQVPPFNGQGQPSAETKVAVPQSGDVRQLNVAINPSTPATETSAKGALSGPPAWSPPA